MFIYRYNSNIIEIVTTGTYQDNDEEKLLRTDILYMGTLFFVCFGYIYNLYQLYISIIPKSTNSIILVKTWFYFIKGETAHESWKPFHSYCTI